MSYSVWWTLEIKRFFKKENVPSLKNLKNPSWQETSKHKDNSKTM